MENAWTVISRSSSSYPTNNLPSGLAKSSPAANMNTAHTPIMRRLFDSRPLSSAVFCAPKLKPTIGAVPTANPIKIAWNIMLTYISTPYAATPSAPAYFISCILYSMLTIDMETLLINSDEPFVQVLSSTLPSNLNFTRRRRLSFLRAKYTSGTTPPINSLIAVAAAAPVTPSGITPTSRASRIMFATPDATVTYRPSLGFSAVANRHWNSNCRI